MVGGFKVGQQYIWIMISFSIFNFEYEFLFASASFLFSFNSFCLPLFDIFILIILCLLWGYLVFNSLEINNLVNSTLNWIIWFFLNMNCFLSENPELPNLIIYFRYVWLTVIFNWYHGIFLFHILFFTSFNDLNSYCMILVLQSKLFCINFIVFLFNNLEKLWWFYIVNWFRFELGIGRDRINIFNINNVFCGLGFLTCIDYSSV